ncbi:arylsulfatase B-like [Schistocerca cancellata]|uniref:arylsulfatase B-like n=1 Tax=Schistocerca cancellata TaxID=274614 RepID=UPI002119847E|nr:arylsulfatase B-like [Schistocerca cancellata]
MKTSLAVALLVASFAATFDSHHTSCRPPHIIFIIVDDMGWNDVSFHGSDQIPTPNIDALAYHGVILNQHYVQAICTPSRAALMTSRYPVRIGMQGVPIYAAEPRGLPEGKILPQYLKELGYVTRAVGKWHLGYHRADLTPTYRGFDSHLGYWNGFVGYYDYILQAGNLNGYDLRRNMSTAWDLSGRYATDVFTEEAERLIGDHDTSKPLFLYLAHLAMHAGNPARLLEAPQEYISRFGYISDPNRRVYAGAMAKLDESVGRVVTALERRGMLENSVIVFSSDNGAPTIGEYPNWGSNYPFRGLKETLWEGGVRVASLVWSPLLQNTPRVSHQLMHVTDWLPTLYSAACGDASSLPRDLDGVDQWEALVSGSLSRRTELLLNADEASETAAVRVGDWKLVIGTLQNGSLDGFFGASGREDAARTPPYDPEAVASSPCGRAVSLALGAATPVDAMLRLRRDATVSCASSSSTPRCVPRSSYDACLFNLREDPCEQEGVVAGSQPLLKDFLLERLVALRTPWVRQADLLLQNSLADPAHFNNTWSPWTDCLCDYTDSFCNHV